MSWKSCNIQSRNKNDDNTLNLSLMPSLLERYSDKNNQNRTKNGPSSFKPVLLWDL
jgi:hypothetical protein